MLQNYDYFLALAETLNISRAAQKLFVSHQCLSRYLKTLEDECGLTLFQRKPTLSLTHAGQILLDSLRQVQRVEQNTSLALAELRSGNTGVVRLGLTEGRLRIFLPELLRRYQTQFPQVTLKVVSDPSTVMLQALLDNKLDLVLGGTAGRLSTELEYTTILEEDLYLVVSDGLLRRYFPDTYPACQEVFATGADIRLFQEMPFCAAAKGYQSRTMIDELLQKTGATLDIIYEGNQPDLLHIMTAQDYAASFCLSMYLPHIRTLNRAAPEDGQLRVFPLLGLTAKNPVFLISQRGTFFPQYTKALIRLIRTQCRAYGEWVDEPITTKGP